MRVRNTKGISVDCVQLYASQGAVIHPELYQSFLFELKELEHKDKLCLLPKTRLETYSYRVCLNLKRRLTG